MLNNAVQCNCTAIYCIILELLYQGVIYSTQGEHLYNVIAQLLYCTRCHTVHMQGEHLYNNVIAQLLYCTRCHIYIQYTGEHLYNVIAQLYCIVPGVIQYTGEHLYNLIAQLLYCTRCHTIHRGASVQCNCTA